MKRFFVLSLLSGLATFVMGQVPFKSELLEFSGQVVVESAKNGKLFPLKRSQILLMNKNEELRRIQTDGKGCFKTVVDTTFQFPLEDLRMEVMYRGKRLEVAESYRGLGKVLVIPYFEQPTQNLVRKRFIYPLWTGEEYSGKELRRFRQ